MPTPFTHLATVAEMLSLPALSPDVKRALEAERPAFLLGNIAPDVQTVSGQTREATHFFPVPLDGAPPAPGRMFELYPSLAARTGLPQARAAFLAGYLAHLVFDQLWIERVFEPAFGPQQTWGTFRERLYLHNVLRAYWDAEDLVRLAHDVASELCQAAPDHWLPFVDDRHLATWRDLVGDQLGPGASRTVEVFAARMKVDPLPFAELLASPEAMEQRVFSRAPREALAAYRAEALEQSLDVILAYWRGDQRAPRL